MEDFSSLGSLPSLGVGLSSENPSWNRNLFEIKAASDSLWTSNQSPSRAGDMPRTSSLLGSRNLPDLGVSSGKPPQRAESDFLRWGEANRRQEVDILKRMVKKAEQSTRKKTQDLIEKQLQEDWERTRDLFSKQLVGSRTLGGSATNKAPVTNDNLLLLESSVGQAPVPTSGLGQRVQDPMARQINPQAAHSHLAIVKRLQQNGQNNFKLMSEAANEFAKIAESCGSDSPQYRYYSTTLQLTSRILARKDFSPVEISMATLDYFSNQFEYYMLSQNRTATLPVQGGSQEASSVHRAHYKNTNANTIAVFASTELGRSIEASFWPCLYYALRIGDAVAAKEIYESNSASCEENDDTKTAILNLLTALAQHQGSGANIWEAMGLPQLPLQYTSVIGEACERAKKQGDDYRTGSLSLLGGIDELPTATLPGLNTIEDYLFGLLWLALRKPEPVSELKAVGKKILSYGSNYFGEEQGGWSYAFPLFVAQQYQTALLFLREAGGATGLMQATHLGMLLTSCGVALNNLGETNPQPEYKLFTSLLVEYGTWLHADPNSGAVCALDYLRWLPDRNVLAKEVVQLMLRANNVFELVGNLSPQGTRTEGALDYYFSKKEVCSFIKHAAEVLEKDTNDRDKVATAGKLFMLAGNFRALLRLLSKLLSPATTDVSKLFSPDRTSVQTDGDKKYWYEQAQGFFNTYFDNGPTHVSDCVIKNKDTDAVDTCKALMMLFYSFERFGNGAHESARSILDRLDIIPKTLSDVSSKEARYRTSDKLFQEAIPAALEATLRSLRHEYYHLKSSYGSKDDVRNALIQVKERAKAIVTFAGLIAPNVDPDKRKYLSQLAQWEAEMI